MSQEESEPRTPYSPPEVEELGSLDAQTQAIVSAVAEPEPERPGPHLPR